MMPRAFLCEYENRNALPKWYHTEECGTYNRSDFDEKTKTNAEKSSTVFVYTANSFDVLPVFRRTPFDGNEKQLYRLVRNQPRL